MSNSKLQDTEELSALNQIRKTLSKDNFNSVEIMNLKPQYLQPTVLGKNRGRKPVGVSPRGIRDQSDLLTSEIDANSIIKTPALNHQKPTNDISPTQSIDNVNYEIFGKVG